MKLLSRLNTVSMHMLTLAGVLAIASAIVNIVTALTMYGIDKLDGTGKEA